ncbi:MAG: putative sugar nucleotidyl transferase [Ferruginibacter sp.]
MAIIFDDIAGAESLYPFTATRSAADIRIGILTIREKWPLIIEKYFADEMQDICINANIIPTKASAASMLKGGQLNSVNEVEGYRVLEHPWQIFQWNDWALRNDFELLTSGRVSSKISGTNTVIGNGNIFIEPGAIVEHATLNTTTGPVYIGKNAEVQEGCLIRGPFSLGEGAVLKMGSKIYGATTIGPYCTAAGEVKNSVMFGYSNKGHDGYLGDSVIGEWCNLGAGTSNSNVMNTAGTVKVWDNGLKEFAPVGLKCGLLMGDYSRAATNTSFNTGTVIGVGCNIFGTGFPPKLVPDFTWGTERYTFEKLLKDINNWKALKGQQISEHETAMLKQLYFKN